MRFDFVRREKKCKAHVVTASVDVVDRLHISYASENKVKQWKGDEWTGIASFPASSCHQHNS